MMSPAGFDHGRFASRIDAALENHVSRHGLGVVTTAEAGFQVAHDPDTVRAPDVAFVRAHRIPSGGVKGFFQGAPDLAVEVVSPSDRASEVTAKVQEVLHRDKGEQLASKVMDSLKDVSDVEQRPKFDGRNIIIVFAPK